jgi:hypothetical protein
VNIKAVDNFAYSSGDEINICFTTVQGLFSDFHNEKENALTIEDFKENKIALIADEQNIVLMGFKDFFYRIFPTGFRNGLAVFVK